jgi:hypothetical protein
MLPEMIYWRFIRGKNFTLARCLGVLCRYSLSFKKKESLDQLEIVLGLFPKPKDNKELLKESAGSML